jgi:hypothetical protein
VAEAVGDRVHVGRGGEQVRLGSLAYAAETDKGPILLELRGRLAGKFNSLLSEALLLDTEPVVGAARAVDRELVALTAAAGERVWSVDE